MKRHVQNVGVRKWAGGDLVELQAETLKALDGFFARYGACVLNGCDITQKGGTFEVSAGLVVLKGRGHQDQEAAMIVPFEGVQGVSLPLYLTLAYTVREREYADGRVKPVAYDYHARASTVAPADGIPYLALTTDAVPRFVDVLQDAKHRFLTDAERAVWNAKETTDGASTKAEAALRSAKDYTDTRETAVLATVDTKNTEILRSANEATIIALEGKLDKNETAVASDTLADNDRGELSGCLQYFQRGSQNATGDLPSDAWWHVVKMNHANGDTYFNRTLALDFHSDDIYTRRRVLGTAHPWQRLYHTGNLTAATTSANGLMTAADKNKLDGMTMKVTYAGSVTATGSISTSFTGIGWYVNKQGTGLYRVFHNTNDYNMVMVTATGTDAPDRIATVRNKYTNQFDVAIGNGANAYVDCSFDFFVCVF